MGVNAIRHVHRTCHGEKTTQIALPDLDMDREVKTKLAP